MPLIEDYALQHTKAVMAISAITAPLEVLAPSAAPGSKFDQQIRKVMHWRNVCSQINDAKKISARAERALDAKSARLFPHMQTTHLPDDERARRWAELLWVGAILTADVRNTCPDFGKSRPWGYLDTTAWTLGHMLMKLVPGCDERGTELYMEIYND